MGVLAEPDLSGVQPLTTSSPENDMRIDLRDHRVSLFCTGRGY